MLGVTSRRFAIGIVLLFLMAAVGIPALMGYGGGRWGLFLSASAYHPIVSDVDGMAADRYGNLYTVCSLHMTTRKIDQSGLIVSTYQSPDMTIVKEGVGIPFPVGIAVDFFGNIFVGYGDTGIIRKFDPNGKKLAEWHPFTTKGTHYARNIGVDAHGCVYAMDSESAQIVKLDSSGRRTAAWKCIDEQAAGTIAAPVSMAVDGNGYTYVAFIVGIKSTRAMSVKVRKFDSTGKALLTWPVLRPGGGMLYDPKITVNAGNIFVLGRTKPVAEPVETALVQCDQSGRATAEFLHGPEPDSREAEGMMKGFTSKAIAVDGQGNIYAGGYERGIWKVNPTTGQTSWIDVHEMTLDQLNEQRAKEESAKPLTLLDKNASPTIVWSGDGRYLYYPVAQQLGGLLVGMQICRYDVLTKTKDTYSVPIAALDFDLSPDASSIVYVTGEHELGIYKPDDKSTQSLHPSVGSSPIVSVKWIGADRLLVLCKVSDTRLDAYITNTAGNLIAKLPIRMLSYSSSYAIGTGLLVYAASENLYHVYYLATGRDRLLDSRLIGIPAGRCRSACMGVVGRKAFFCYMKDSPSPNVKRKPGESSDDYDSRKVEAVIQAGVNEKDQNFEHARCVDLQTMKGTDLNWPGFNGTTASQDIRYSMMMYCRVSPDLNRYALWSFGMCLVDLHPRVTVPSAER
jgi:streptogramin lyase